MTYCIYPEYLDRGLSKNCRTRLDTLEYSVWSRSTLFVTDQAAIFQTHQEVSECYITKTSLFKYTENFTTKNWKFSDKNSDIFHISAQNQDCGYSLQPPEWGSSNEYPQSMFLSRNKKNNVYPSKPQFYYIKVGVKVPALYRYVFAM